MNLQGVGCSFFFRGKTRAVHLEVVTKLTQVNFCWHFGATSTMHEKVRRDSEVTLQLRCCFDICWQQNLIGKTPFILFSREERQCSKYIFRVSGSTLLNTCHFLTLPSRVRSGRTFSHELPLLSKPKRPSGEIMLLTAHLLLFLVHFMHSPCKEMHMHSGPQSVVHRTGHVGTLVLTPRAVARRQPQYKTSGLFFCTTMAVTCGFRFFL